MPRIVHFEIPADNTERAKKFYEKVFGWKITSMPEMNYFSVITTPIDKKRMPKERGALNGGMMKRSLMVKNPVVTISVKSIDTALKKLAKAGGKVTAKKMSIGEMGYIAYFKDTEGNVIGLWQAKK